MDEMYRMLGREHQADLDREARKHALASRLPSRRPGLTRQVSLASGGLRRARTLVARTSETLPDSVESTRSRPQSAGWRTRSRGRETKPDCVQWVGDVCCAAPSRAPARRETCTSSNTRGSRLGDYRPERQLAGIRGRDERGIARSWRSFAPTRTTKTDRVGLLPERQDSNPRPPARKAGAVTRRHLTPLDRPRPQPTSLDPN